MREVCHSVRQLQCQDCQTLSIPFRSHPPHNHIDVNHVLAVAVHQCCANAQLGIKHRRDATGLDKHECHHSKGHSCWSALHMSLAHALQLPDNQTTRLLQLLPRSPKLCHPKSHGTNLPKPHSGANLDATAAHLCCLILLSNCLSLAGDHD